MTTRQVRTRGKSCGNKKAHDTWAQANAQIDRLVALGAYRDNLVAYPCKKCGKKHVGHRFTTKRGQR